MDRIKSFLNSLLGRINIDQNSIDSNRTILLHISDTPSFIYPEIKRVIKLVNPDYIVHTGDIADNIKLGLHPSYMTRYMHEAKKILRILDDAKARRVYLTLGNHDNLDFISENSHSIKIIEDRTLLHIGDKDFAISHYSDSLKDVEADVYLYGHDLSIDSQTIDGRIHLNGISAIHLIDVETLEVTKLNYPMGTDQERMKRRKTKL
jgi:3',5'-cyclic AMP phosphodiesterase CpdA